MNGEDLWKKLHTSIDKFNEDKYIYSEPFWGTDCGLKVDFDGPLVHVESRFYFKGEGKYTGGVRINLLQTLVAEKDFVADSLEELRPLVEEYVRDFAKNKIKIG